MHQRNMRQIGSAFPELTARFLDAIYPSGLPKKFEKDDAANASATFNTAAPPDDNWGLEKPLPKFDSQYTFKRVDGQVSICDQDGAVPKFAESQMSRDIFLGDYERLVSLVDDAPLNSFCRRRLTWLQHKYELHTLFNDGFEKWEQKRIFYRDFNNVRKADTHIHAAAAMTQPQMLEFMKKTAKRDADRIVLVKNSKSSTMTDLLPSLGMEADDISADLLDMQADRDMARPFDKFNTKYNPMGSSVLREVFLKTDNIVKGEYFACLPLRDAARRAVLVLPARAGHQQEDGLRPTAKPFPAVLCPASCLLPSSFCPHVPVDRLWMCPPPLCPHCFHVCRWF